jgi:hypothetical protein
MKPMIKQWRGYGLLIGMTAAGLGAASGPAAAGAFEPGQWQMASAARLEAMRGGFEAAPGLKVSFGMVRSVAINGELVSRTSFQLPDMSRITEAQARMASLAMRDAGLVQNGPGNYLQRDPQAASGAASVATQTSLGAMPGLGAATVIQNTLDNQVIRQITEISTGVNTLGVLKMVNAQAALKDALLGGLGTR